jgi:signal transduction histidine kinase
MLLFITLSIVSTMISELAFTFYVSVYGFSNFTGHIFKIIEFYLIYKAIIQSGLKTPLNSLFLKLKRSEESYKEAYDRARLYKDIFSHDIGNIIQNISLSVEFSKTSKNKSNIEYDMLNIIEDQIFRAKNLIKNVQKLSEIEKTTPPLIPIKIIEKLRESVNFIHNSFPETDLKIDVDLNFDDVPVLANELIVDVFENILVNSINYNENPHKEISIKASELEENNKQYIKLEFEDNGIGIEDSRKTIIFHRGHHGEKGSKGMGLGLSLVKKIITLYNGKIWIEDRVRGDSSKGSNFVILLQKAIN